MRDPARIEPILAQLGQLWHQNPDQRLTQLLVNLTRTGEVMPKFFYTEDDRVEDAITAALASGLGEQHR